jgi:Flp pilus assembly protein TadD
VYLDNVFRGAIRPAGTLRVESLAPGPHPFSADFPNGPSLHGFVTLSELPARVSIAPPAQPATAPVAEAATAAALEETGQACVSDYVQSTATGLKRGMLARSLEAFERLQSLRPGDPSIETRKLFCRGRLLIAESRFLEAVTSLEASLKRDPRFACAYNALGVALARVNRMKESRQAFETAAKLTPEWALPPFQIAQQLVTDGQPGKAVPYLEKAVAYNPRSVVNRWNLTHVLRLSGNAGRAEREATELIRLDPNYPPAYLELGQAREALRDFGKAADAYDTYVQLAPNYAGTQAVRARAASLHKGLPISQ